MAVEVYPRPNQFLHLLQVSCVNKVATRQAERISEFNWPFNYLSYLSVSICYIPKVILFVVALLTPFVFLSTL